MDYIKISLWIIFILVFVWIVSVLVALFNPSAIFGPINIITAVVIAVIILALVEIIR